jgi:hypothetical protein
MEKVLGTDGLMRDLDEHYICMNDVSEDPHGAWEAIQLLWEKKVELETQAVVFRESIRKATLDSELGHEILEMCWDSCFPEMPIIKDKTNE